MAQLDSHPRLILHNFLPLDLCKELEFIHKSCSTVGYRPNVFSTTLSHLIATNSAHLMLPFVSIRERLKEKAEEFFGCEYELFIEFTGLISWTKGSSIGWHSDDNRPYLKQRAFAAVCYLNSHGEEFEGGLFHFQDGEPKTIVPVTGDVVMYTADSRNIHSVDKIIEGERLTLTLWFTRESSHDEDSKLISLLSQTVLRGPLEESVSYLPLPAPSNMYLFSPEQFSDGQLGFDIRLARVNVLGFTFYFLDDKNLTEDPACHSSEPLMQPLLLAREGQIFYKEFVNSLHALQVVQFYCWKVSEHQASDSMSGDTNVLELIISCPEESYSKKSVCPDDLRLAEMVFCSVAYNVYRRSPFNWEKFSAVVAAWEGYSCQLHRKLYASLPYWKTHQSIFSVPLFGLKKDTL